MKVTLGFFKSEDDQFMFLDDILTFYRNNCELSPTSIVISSKTTIDIEKYLSSNFKDSEIDVLKFDVRNRCCQMKEIIFYLDLNSEIQFEINEVPHNTKKLYLLSSGKPSNSVAQLVGSPGFNLIGRPDKPIGMQVNLKTPF